jgi:aromatic-L-amino-acid decarboxylase
MVRRDPRFDIVAPHPLNLLCVSLGDDDPERANARTDALVERLNASGQAWFTRTVLDGRSVLRVSVGARTTRREHVDAAWRLLTEIADTV